MRNAIKQLLADDDFIRWCFFPEPESETFRQAWEERNSCKEEDITEARTIVRGLRLNDYTLSEDKSERLHIRIFQSLEKRRWRKKMYVITCSAAAACIALFLLLQTSFLKQSVPATDYLSEMKIHSGDNNQTEIELNLSNEKKIQIPDKTDIKVDSLGSVRIVGKGKTETKLAKSDRKPNAGKMNTLTVPKGRRSSIVLKDGTKIRINSGTVLMFPDDFEEDNRTVYADGEIYLEVAKDSLRPFFVKTQAMDIRVLGTTFNVTTYREEQLSSVVLVEGSVEVGTNTGEKYRMEPQERLIVREDNTVEIETVNTYYYTSWIDGVFLFENKTLDFVLKRLSQYYNVTFDYPQEIADYRCTGKLVLFDDVNAVMFTLRQTFPVMYEIKEYKIMLNSKK
ncbi:MAG: FecR domain-containing protein [Tannerella sp.]|jgi:ferric-dicitrate binding protein FerR (iron transport regulator)|nr:FecR domain-containing protein [Tannerella sp.]